VLVVRVNFAGALAPTPFVTGDSPTSL